LKVLKLPSQIFLKGMAVQYALIALCLVYSISAFTQLLSSRLDNLQTLGIHRSDSLSISDGSWQVDYLLPSSIDHLDDIVLFIDESSRVANEGKSLNLKVYGAESRARSVILGQPNPNFIEFGGGSGDPAGLAFYHLDTSVSETGPPGIRITFQMDESIGFRLTTQPRFSEGRDGALTINNNPIETLDIGIQIRELNSRRLWRLVLTGTLLIVLAMATLWDRRCLPATVLLIGFPLALILAEVCWQYRMDAYWNYYWPDGYTELAHQVRRWVTGESGWTELSGYLSSYRNGQSWLIPTAVGLLASTGASYLLAFTLVNYLAFLVTVLAWVGLMRRASPWTSPLRLSLFVLVLLFHYLHLLSAGTPMTDIGAAAMVALSFYCYFPLLTRNSAHQFAHIALAGTIIALACQTRVALIPLLLMPVVVSICIYLSSLLGRVTGQSMVPDFRHLAIVASPTFVATSILLLFYYLLNLFGTFQLAMQVATSAEFQLGFDKNNFIEFTRNTTIIALLVTAVFWKRFLEMPLLQAIWIFMIGYLAMIYLGQIITWERYWVPIAGGASFAILETLNLARSNRIYLGGAVVVLGSQIYFLLHNNLNLL
jgi:hypothetical protein